MMSRRLAVAGLTAAAVVSFIAVAPTQVRVPGAEYDPDFPAPRRDLSGIWEPARGAGDAIQANGAKNIPDTGRPEHQLPFTPEGLKMRAGCVTSVVGPRLEWCALGDSRLAVPISGRIQLAA
jgi:hypothetical protein